jgi:hypothetical protein
MANYQNRTTEPTQGKEQPEKKLWKAVLNQVFQDAFEYSGNKREEGEKKHALDYLKTMHEDYYMVCEYAGFDPNYVHTKVKKKINMHQLQTSNIHQLKKSGIVWNFNNKEKK